MLFALGEGAKVDFSPVLNAFGGVLRDHWGMLVLIVMILVVGAAIPVAAKKRSQRGDRGRGNGGVRPGSVGQLGAFGSATGLLTAAEAAFLPVLRAAVGADTPDGPRIMTKVRLVDIVSPPKDSPTWQADFNRVAQKHVDFVICAGDRMLPMRVVELDDSTHDRADRRGRDELVDAVLKRAGIPVTHVRCRATYEVEEVRSMLKKT